MVSFSHSDTGTSAAQWNAAGLVSLEPLPVDEVFSGADHLLVLAAHPDDETLGAGGLIQLAVRAGLRVTVVLCTNGEASHPQSTTHTPDRLGAIRLEEMKRALACLLPAGSDPAVLHLHPLNLPDGQLQRHAPRVEQLVQALMERSNCALASTYRADGHPDHEALGQIAARLAVNRGAFLLEYPIWYWHWASPADDTRWRQWKRLPLDAAAARHKTQAMAAHASQTAPLSPRAGDETLLPPRILEHFRQDREVFRITRPGERDAALAGEVFDRLYAEREDPWSYRDSFYEERKREILLASLPHREYGRALEVGCSIGIQTAALARRCRSLTALDASARALRQAAGETRGLPNVRLLHALVPRQWPDLEAGSLDLVILSEVGYFLAPDELSEVLDHCERSLMAGGHLVLCHWLHEVKGWPLDGRAVHEMAGRRNLRREVRHEERDFLLEVLSKPGA